MEKEKYQIKRINLQDTEKWIAQLHQVGAVVIKNIISQEEIKKTHDLFWEFLQSLGSGINRNDSSTWNDDNWPALPGNGFFNPLGGCHMQASWFLRCRPRVQEAFKKIWKNQDLITSFDTIIGWRPWWVNQQWHPFTLDLHLDQNPYHKKGFKCIQGMIPLKNVRESQVGGLQVVPFSKNDQQINRIINENHKIQKYSGDYVRLFINDPLYQKKVLVECDAGDLILWDSRTAHGAKCNEPSQQFKQKNKNEMARISFVVCMLPRQSASQQVLKRRKQAFKKRMGTTHWANQCNQTYTAYKPRNLNPKFSYKYPEMTPQIEKIV